MRLLLTTVAFVTISASLSAHGSSKWEAFHDEDGITVWRREVPGSSFVAFRGLGQIEAPIVQVVAVIRGAGRATEWMHRCAGSAIIEVRASASAFVYNRTESPVFFISDRDTVLRTELVVDGAARLVTIPFENVEHQLMPPKEGVVRMPKLNGHWKIKQIDMDTTEVEYQVEADPGGALPAWLVNMASKTLPYDTLQGLRRQVRTGGYEQDRTILLLSSDWKGFELPPEGPVLGAATTATISGGSRLPNGAGP